MNFEAAPQRGRGRGRGRGLARGFRRAPGTRGSPWFAKKDTEKYKFQNSLKKCCVNYKKVTQSGTVQPSGGGGDGACANFLA